MSKQTYKTQIVLILTVTVIGLMLPGLAQAGALRAKEAKGGLSTRAIQREGVREDSSKQDLPAEQKDPPTRTAGAGTLSPAIIASRTSGTAPFAVFFEGTESTDRQGRKIGDSTGGEGLLGNDILEYIWDFGDGNSFSGFNAAHVYETPGTYTVTLTIRDELGSESTTIEVNAQAFSGTTYYVSDSEGEDSYDGLSPTYTGGTNGPWKTYAKAFSAIRNNSIVQPGDRVLFHRGETFTYTIPVNLGSATDVLIGAYGNCVNPDEKGICENNPLIQYAGTLVADDITDTGGASWFRGGSDAISLVDFRVNTESTANGELVDAFATDSTHFLFLRGKLEHYYGFARGGDLFFIVNSILKDASLVNMYFKGDRLVLINNEIGPAIQSHNLYGSKINRGVITGNYFHDTSRHNIRIGANTARSGEIVVSNNEFDGGDNWLSMVLGQSSGGAVPWNAENILIEKNYFHNTQNAIFSNNYGYTDIVIRNNIFDISYTGSGVAFMLRVNNDHSPGTKRLKFLHNTILSALSDAVIKVEQTDHQDIEIFNNIIYGTSSSAGARAIEVADTSAMNEITSNNNLFYFPARGSNPPIFRVGTIDYTLQGWRDNFGEDLDSLLTDPLLVVDPPTTPEDFKLQADSPAIDAGMSLPLVFEDYDKNRRPIDGDTSGTAEWDIGAYEYGLLTLPGDFDQDGDVDMDDYAMFEEAYTGANRPVAPGYEYADLDGDGDVDLDDFSIFAANYTG